MINSDIRDQAYQFFIEEVPELLQAIETGLLSLKQERTKAQVHEIMRAAHSIKGGAASVELDLIKTISHRLEDYFKALYKDTVVIDSELEHLLLQAYDCLREPLIEQLKTGSFDTEKAQAKADPIFAAIDAKLGDALNDADDFIPSSSDLGIDLVSSLFEVDIFQGMEQIKTALDHPLEYNLLDEIKSQSEIFLGLGELLNLPGFTSIVQTALNAVELKPQKVEKIAALFLENLEASRQAVLAGDRTNGGVVSPKLQAILEEPNSNLTQIQSSTFCADPGYQVFVEEALVLLAKMEGDLLSLKHDRSTKKIYEIMRSAHSIKGGAASLGLQEIKHLAHHLEDFFKALHNQEIPIDTELEGLLLQAYDCLRLPLMEQITTGYYNEELARTNSQPIFSQIEEKLGEALKNVNDYVDSSSDLGTNVVRYIFEIDVKQELERLESVIHNPQHYEVKGEIRAMADVFAGFGEILKLPGFKAIATTTLQALELNPEKALDIARLLLSDTTKGRDEVLSGDRSRGGDPSNALLNLAQFRDSNGLTTSTEPYLTQSVHEELEMLDYESFLIESGEELSPSLEELFGTAPETYVSLSDLMEEEKDESGIFEPTLEDVFADSTEPEPINAEVVDTDTTESQLASSPSLEDVFGFEPEILESAVEDIQLIENQAYELQQPLPSLEDIFSEASSSFLENVNLTQNLPQNVPSLDEVFDLNNSDDSFLDAPAPTLEEVFNVAEENDVYSSDLVASQPLIEDLSKAQFLVNPNQEDLKDTQETTSSEINPEPQPQKTIEVIQPATLEESVQSIEEIFNQLPEIKELPVISVKEHYAAQEEAPTAKNEPKTKKRVTNTPGNLSVRVDLNRLETMNNLVGEMSINRNSLSLQNDQLQSSVKELTNRFSRFHKITSKLREISDQMLISPEKAYINNTDNSLTQAQDLKYLRFGDFDSLEMDRYGTIHSMLQSLLEEMMQIEESVDDVVLFAKQSDQTLEQQRQMLTRLRDELMWARMLPLGELLNRFPRMLRDMSTMHNKPTNMKIVGTGVLVDKAALEKLYDPLLHLVRNAFDHGIEAPEIRKKAGKSEEGNIEIRAYHKGNQTIIEISDDGQGLNYEKIGRKAIELGLLYPEQLAVTPSSRLLDFIFEPGFSTAEQVSELSGRGMGLDVVRSQLQSLKGTISVSTNLGKGTTFTLRLPLTLTLAKLLVCLVGANPVAFPSDSIEEIIIPEKQQIKQSGENRFLHLNQSIIPVYSLKETLKYNCAIPESFASKALSSVNTPAEWELPLLIVRRGQQMIALEVERLITEQELVIKPFGSAIAAPSYTYGCTIIGDGTLIPVMNGVVLIEQVFLNNTPNDIVTTKSNTTSGSSNTKTEPNKTLKVETILVIDDSAAMRRTLALSLEKAGYRVIQARDGKEGLDQLQQTLNVHMVICDIEMPNMNGFEFLGQRRRDPQLLKIPVAMLTSRSNDKHRRLAMQLGADAYFTKPYIEQEFIKAIQNTIKTPV